MTPARLRPARPLAAALFTLALAPAHARAAGTATDDEPMRLDAGLHAGALGRLGDAANYAIEDGSGFLFGASMHVWPSRLFGLGLTYESAGLGRERSSTDALGSFAVDRSIDAVFAGVRVGVYEREPLRVALEVAPGLVWQSEHAWGTALDGTTPWSAVAFTCDGAGSADLALRASLAASVQIGGGLSLEGAFGWSGYRLDSEPLGACAPGAGTTGTLSLRAGLSYGFDVAPYVR